MSESTCKHCGVGIDFIRFRRDDGPDTFDWCHSLGGRRCNPLDYTVAEPVSEGI